MPDFIPVLEKGEIARRVAEVARKISSDYQDKDLVIIGVLKGAFVFMADLVRHLTIDVRLDFIGVSSYGSGTCSSEKICLTKEIGIDLADRDVLLVEDIVDTGLTLVFLVDYLKSCGPRSVKICTLIDKLERRKVVLDVDYVCHRVEKGFLVGYGLDYDEKYRNLPGIFHMKL